MRGFQVRVLGSEQGEVRLEGTLIQDVFSIEAEVATLSEVPVREGGVRD